MLELGRTDSGPGLHGSLIVLLLHGVDGIDGRAFMTDIHRGYRLAVRYALND